MIDGTHNTPQDAPDEVAEIEKRLECHYALEAFPDGAMLDDIATLLRLLKQRRLVTRERLAEWFAKENCDWGTPAHIKCIETHPACKCAAKADTLLSADLGFKVVSEDWQLIKTAPKDGRFVWLLMRDIYSDEDAGGTKWRTAKAWWEDGRWHSGQSSHWKAVYWRPDPVEPPRLFDGSAK